MTWRVAVARLTVLAGLLSIFLAWVAIFAAIVHRGGL